MNKPSLFLAALICAAPFHAAADIPQSKETRCFTVSPSGKIGKARACRVEAVGSAPRPNLPDTRSTDYRIGRKHYRFSADYDAASQSWKPEYRGSPLTVYYRDRAFKTLKRENAQARYTCFKATAVHFCAVKEAPPFW